MNAQDAMKKWREKNELRAKKKASRRVKLILDYYDLVDELGIKADKELMRDISIETLAEVVEVLKEKKNENSNSCRRK